ncbi:MAG: hypothetical protein ISN29_05050 [Gammaproteobacteria bacterium AqS3]|nr:hypothetical protein [Gammaproteobacteria bacterium AqS3]
MKTETVYTVLQLPEDWVVVCRTGQLKEAYRIAENRSVDGGDCIVVTDNGLNMGKFRNGNPIIDD